jgi:hypothetical protein
MFASTELKKKVICPTVYLFLRGHWDLDTRDRHVIFCIVAYRPVAKRWLCKRRPFLGNISVNTFPLLGSRFLIMQQLNATNSRTVFSMWSMPRCYKQGTKLVDRSVWEAVKKILQELIASVRLWREDFVWYLECVIQWDCYSSCVKIRCQETASGDCNRLITLVCVSVICKM